MAIGVAAGHPIIITMMNICYVLCLEKISKTTLVSMGVMVCILLSRRLLVVMDAVNQGIGGNLPKLVRVKSRKAKFTINWGILQRMVK